MASRELRTDIPHVARVYDALLGGNTNFPVDRAAAEQILMHFPTAGAVAHANRAFLTRTVSYLAAEHGIRQFLDIGTGIPTSPNLHEVAQAVAPECRVVYADNDPLVLAHARALLHSTRQGRTAYLEADLQDPATILGAPEVIGTLDLTRPVALSLLAILHFLPDSSDPYHLVATLVDALPPGSALTITHGTTDFLPEQGRRAGDVFNQRGIDTADRCHEDILRFFDGLELVEPGVVTVTDWRPPGPDHEPTPLYGGIALKN
ncbi:SAM-dependent methyltransferase [Cryptosporangium sp. NPDC048952]|uniref:SAM-dependent methyltransferase n=1 Tax=Cryptosporangium sp. NPDC048952 TaxID=3363961 RepID=UPI003718AB8C